MAIARGNPPARTRTNRAMRRPLAYMTVATRTTGITPLLTTMADHRTAYSRTVRMPTGSPG
jgi:hypothetical protein